MDTNGENIIRLENGHEWERYPDWFDPAYAPTGFSADKLMKTWAWIKQDK
jgi:hypothetical protein